MEMIFLFITIGLAGGIAAGTFGVGGGVVIVPMLVYWAGFSQHKATGTSLALLLPPIGLAAVIEFYKRGNVDLQAAFLMAGSMFFGAWLGAYLANRIGGPRLVPDIRRLQTLGLDIKPLRAKAGPASIDKGFSHPGFCCRK